MKTGYKHYSFDLWQTLIRSNPAFKAERARYFHQRYNRSSKSLEEVTAVFRQVDLMCNAINEKTGNNIDAEEMYLMVIDLVNGIPGYLSEINIDALYTEMENLVWQYLPQVYNAETIPVLDFISSRGNNTIGLLSNTGFIRGRTLRQVLKQLQLDGYFHFQLYSDELGMSKPSLSFFQHMIQTAASHPQHEQIALHEIVHIGDNPLADIGGGEAAGIHTRLINSNRETIQILLQ